MKKIVQKFNKLIICVMLLCVLLPTPVANANFVDDIIDVTADWVTDKLEKAAELLPIEEWFAGLFRGLANALNYMVSKAVGTQISIDDVVFNQYAPVKVDYFDTLKDGEVSEIIWGTGGMPGLATTVNECYNFFNKIAIMVYMVMLVYMGVRILLSSTGKSVSHYKTLFMYWVVGVAILFLYPFVMKYIIQMNNVMVDMIYVEAQKEIDEKYRKNALPAATTDSLEKIDFDKNPFDGSGTDYMSQIANEAEKTKSLALAFAYLILTWQLITIVLHYYKRLIMIGFLIAIFPLVAMFYAVDKIADGKSQAFDHWNKEFILNVFIQSFHAIVYVFVCGSVMATSEGTGFDYIIVITGATFLFTGEEIVKKIFSQDSGVKSGAAQGLGSTAAWSMAKVTAVTGVAAKVSKNLVGRDSAAMKIRNAWNQKRAANAKLDVFDTFATNMEKPNSGMKLDSMEGVMEGINNNTDMDREQKRAAKAEAIKVANAVADLNNPNTRSVSELQEAYEIVQNTMLTDPDNVILNDLKFTPDQMSRIDGLGREVATLVANGNMDPIQVEQHIKARLGYYMGEDLSESSKEKYTNMVLLNMSLYGASRYDDPDGSAENEVNRSISALSREFSTFRYREAYDPENDVEESRKEEIRRLALDGVERLLADGEEATKEELELAEGLLILGNRNLGIYTAEEYLEAAKKVNKNLEYDSEVARELAKTFNMDTDVLQHVLARKAKQDGVESESVKETLKEYETDVRDGYNDDEVSAHELIQLMYDDSKTDVEKESARRDVIDRVSAARRRSKAKEIEYTQAIAEDILFTKQVDVEAGRIDTQTRFLNGQTREDILKERRNAKVSILRNLAGIKDTPTTGRYSDAYVENMKNHSGHRRGDGN